MWYWWVGREFFMLWIWGRICVGGVEGWLVLVVGFVWWMFLELFEIWDGVRFVYYEFDFMWKGLWRGDGWYVEFDCRV